MIIGICDDEKYICEMLERHVNIICPEAEVLLFSDGKSLLSYAGNLDILFLDIQMEGIDGMEAARELRRTENGVTIIFVTALEEYVYQAFDVEAFHYLVKPFTWEKFSQVLKAALKRHTKEVSGMKETERSIVVKSGSSHVKIPIENIIFAEVFNRKVVIHTREGDVEYYGKLADLERMAGEDFFRPHRAYLVNFKYIFKYDARTIYLEGGEVLMAKQKYPEFVKQYLQYNRRKAAGHGNK
ncbi:MAG: LytTR family DNA-binding domain-containing protein [Lachnospiraceae bacterium]|nr:LytTR family DNA-binding domain-containing protein [Lachnospiraceae bacterium]MDE6982432.1 LytTR family DNA-binding domain-containing protein [Lachnospiraceae bacterium]